MSAYWPVYWNTRNILHLYMERSIGAQMPLLHFCELESADWNMKQFRFILPTCLVGVEKVQRETLVGELVSTRPWVPTPDPAGQSTYHVAPRIARQIGYVCSFIETNMNIWLHGVPCSKMKMVLIAYRKTPNSLGIPNLCYAGSAKRFPKTQFI